MSPVFPTPLGPGFFGRFLRAAAAGFSYLNAQKVGLHCPVTFHMILYLGDSIANQYHLA